jgi:dinuclear metal center YbgI/SA1388 family protein
MRLETIIHSLHAWAPSSYQEAYDNSRLLCGNKSTMVVACLVCLDVTEAVVREAIARKANLIIAHHPLIFSGLKSLTGKNDAERALILAIKSEVAIFALHTNLDNVASGVNWEIANRLGINTPRILAPKTGLLKKLVVTVPKKNTEALRLALWEAGAGAIGNYDQCSFSTEGQGTFRPLADAAPQIGEIGKKEVVTEDRLEMLIEVPKLSAVLKAMHASHPYEEVAYEIYTIENQHQSVGSGMFGEWEEALPVMEALHLIKSVFGGVVRYTHPPKGEIKRLAWCGGSGSFLLPQAKSVGADLFMTSDFKYHQFFEADNEILIADIGHYENEQFTIDLIVSHLREKFTTFAVLLTENSTNPINYL